MVQSTGITASLVAAVETLSPLRFRLVRGAGVDVAETLGLEFKNRTLAMIEDIAVGVNGTGTLKVVALADMQRKSESG
ncbi:MAG: hypothetical protein EBZ48_16900 [Proteobacteria bacterium]|nr:hypothetical protein [Pseudomonadota bacterium]